MIDLNYVYSFFAEPIRENSAFRKQMLKEYVQLMLLDRLSTFPEANHLTFIGGTNLRLVHHIDRFSEDLDFDCKQITENDFKEISLQLVDYLSSNGIKAECREKDTSHLTAFRRSIYFPELLFELGLTGHREERFLIKMEAQDQGVDYEHEVVNISGCGFFFPMQVPSAAALCSMKLSALLQRAKGRDFYDVMFLMQKTLPDIGYLAARDNIQDNASLLKRIDEKLSTIDLNIKKNDFKHLLFQPEKAEQVVRFKEFIHSHLS